MRPLVLSLDTSTPTLSCALLARLPDGIRLLGRRSASPPAVVSTLVPGLFQALLDDAGADLDEVGAVVAGLGPGLFTGARVAVATMKAVAYARRIPLLGAGSLEAMALEALAPAAVDGAAMALPSDDMGGCCPVIDARKGEVYFATYRWERGLLVCDDAPRSTSPELLRRHLTEAARARPVGAGVRVLGDGWTASDPLTPSAAHLAQLALLRTPEPVFALDEVLAIEPTYLRPPEAEVARQKRLALAAC
jgi:tRNA threonylcarbamoyladenosine biosynthesis protein TsaB